MMDAVSDDPLNRPAFDGQRAASHQKVLDQFRDSITTMRNQAVKAHADSETAGDPVENYCADQCRPAPEKERGDCRRREPVDLEHLVVCQVAVVADVAHRRGHHVP